MGRTAALAAAEHLHAVGDDFGGVAILPFLVLPLSRLQASLDVDLAAFFQVLAGDFGLPAEKDDAVPLGLFLLLTGLVLPSVGSGEANIGHGVAAGRISGFRIAPQVADQNHLVD